MKAQFYLITGFLGSGKTTFLKQLLSEMGSQRRIAVIQNEYAPTGIDGQLLQQSGSDFKLVEINNGSVFCVCQLSNFEKTTLQLIEDYKPELIFLEASGLADPISIAELMSAQGLKEHLSLEGIITLVDLPHFERCLQMMSRFKHQMMIADTIIANKSDLFQGNRAQVKDQIAAINPFAEVYFSEYAQVDWNAICTPHAEVRTYMQYQHQEAAGRPDWACSVLRTHDLVDEDKFHLFLKKIMPSAPRIKGFMRLSNGKIVAIQTSFDDLEIKEIDHYTGRGELIVFSPELSTIDIRKLFNNTIQ